MLKRTLCAHLPVVLLPFLAGCKTGAPIPTPTAAPSQTPEGAAEYPYNHPLNIRNENPEVARGETQIVETLTSGHVCAVKKAREGGEVLIVYNIGAAAELSLAGMSYASYALYGCLTVGATPVSLEHETLSLPACGIAVLR